MPTSSSTSLGRTSLHSALNRLASLRNSFHLKSSSSRHTVASRYPSLADVEKVPSSRDLKYNKDDDDSDNTETESTYSWQDDDDDDVAVAVPPPVARLQPTISASTIAAIPSSTSTKRTIQLCPGLYKELRGSAETQRAWECGECMETTCLACHLCLACIDDVEFVICPECLSVSALTQVRGKTDKTRDRYGGVGLGISLNHYDF